MTASKVPQVLELMRPGDGVWCLDIVAAPGRERRGIILVLKRVEAFVLEMSNQTSNATPGLHGTHRLEFHVGTSMVVVLVACLDVGLCRRPVHVGGRVKLLAVPMVGLRGVDG